VALASYELEMSIQSLSIHEKERALVPVGHFNFPLEDRLPIGAMDIDEPAARSQFDVELAVGVRLGRAPGFATVRVHEEQACLAYRQAIAANDFPLHFTR